MAFEAFAVGPVPPLRMAWRSSAVLSVAVVGNGRLYGISADGRLAAYNATDGSKLWEAVRTYVDTRLVIHGTRLIAYRLNEGLGFVDDMGSSASETLSVSFGASSSASMSSPVVDGEMVYYAVNEGLYAAHQTNSLQYGFALGGMVPHSVALISSRELVVINGRGIPTRFHASAEAFTPVWLGEDHGIDAGQTDRPFVIAGNRLIIGVGQHTVAYDLSTGLVAWQLPNVPAQALAHRDGVVYAGFHGAAIWAIRASDGAVLWQRQYMYDVGLFLDYGLALAGDYLYFGARLQTNPDGVMLMAIRSSDGAFAWLSRAAASAWAGGKPLTDGFRIYAYGGNHTGAFEALPSAPRVTPDLVELTPRPLQGSSGSFGTGSFRVQLPVQATLSVRAYREQSGIGTVIVNNVTWGAGHHEVSWPVAGSSGYSDVNQFGYILVDVKEISGLSYTQALLLPVNTFPDILWHWARSYIEVMAYHKFVNGYPDQTFGPANLVTRGESSTIIAKTLNLEGPSPGFQTKLTDISTHWARNYIMALEERGVVTGVLEPDGTYTFRPNNGMTRGEEARILLRAYSIPPAPTGFRSKFTDIAGHWAEADIKALEAAGYVSGIREPDGSFTFRPQQHLSRAELCTLMVRIRSLSR